MSFTRMRLLPWLAAAAASVAASFAVAACSVEPPPTGATTPEVHASEVEPIDFDALWVLNAESATVSVIDVATDTVARTIGLRGVAYPHTASLSPDGATVAIAAPGMDMSLGHAEHATSTGGGGHGGHGGGGVSSRQGLVLLLDARTGRAKGARKTDAMNHNAVFEGDGRAVWTTQTTSPGSVLVLDPSTLDVQTAVTVGSAPALFSFDTSGRYGLVANSGSASLTVIDVAARRVQSIIDVGNGPVSAAAAPDGAAYVVNELEQSVSVVDLAAGRMVRTLPLGFRVGTLVVRDAGEIWLTNPAAGTVEARGPDGALRASIPTGAGALGLVLARNAPRAYVTNVDAGTVSVVDVAARAVIATVPVGARPNGMLLLPAAR